MPCYCCPYAYDCDGYYCFLEDHGVFYEDENSGETPTTHDR